MQLPPRVQAQLQAAEALEAADQAARAQVPPALSSVPPLLTAVAAPVAVAPPQAVAPAPAPAAPKDDFEHKYRVLQGMYAADVTQLKASVKALTDQVQSRQAPAAPQEQAPAVDPRDVEAFGNDMMDMVRRYVTAAVDTLAARVQALEAQQGSVTQDMAATKDQQFYTLLDNLVPSWRAVNETQAWLTWLGVVDEVYGVQRQKALDHAFANLNAAQVAKVFSAYIASIPVAPATPSLENQITPDGAGNQAPPAAEAKPILSERAITAFYNDMARGNYRGREAEAESIEAQINAAVAEGRVSK